MLAIWITPRLLKDEYENLKGAQGSLVSLQRYQMPSAPFLVGDRGWQQISISKEPSCFTDVNIKMGGK